MRRFKSKAYRSWIAGELKSLLAQKAKPFGKPAHVSITLPLGTRGDADNRVKPTLDLLVRAGILPDDRSDYVKSIFVAYGGGDKMEVTLRAA